MSIFCEYFSFVVTSMLFSEIALYELLEHSEIPTRNSSSAACKDLDIYLYYTVVVIRLRPKFGLVIRKKQGQKSGRQEKPHCSFVGHLSSLFGSLF